MLVSISAEGAKFMLGVLIMTPGATRIVDGETASRLLRRHMTGDWGDVVREDRDVNDDALKNNGRLMSVYKVNGEKVWIITEHDRSVTTILLPEEY